MAARTRKTELDDRWREKIRTSMLINRLRNHVLGRIEMSATQVRAAEILLRKSLPDLASVEHSGEVKVGLVELLSGLRDGDGASHSAQVASEPSQLRH